MSSIERKSAGQLVSRALAPTGDPNEFTWTHNPDHLWYQFSNLPESVVAQFAVDKLLPDAILLEAFQEPDKVTKNVVGWLVGRNGFSMFTLIPAGKSKWALIGSFTEFQQPAKVVTLNIKSDLEPNTDFSSQDKIGIGEDLELASVLPSNLRKKLHAIKAKKIYICDATRYGPDFPGKFSYSVSIATYNSTHFLAIVATQEIDVYQGETQSNLDQRIANAPWTAKVLHEKYA